MPRPRQSASAQKNLKKQRNLRFGHSHKPVWLQLNYISKLESIQKDGKMKTIGEAAVVAIDSYM